MLPNRHKEARLPRLGGVLQPVFALRTEDDLGIGDTDGVRQMIDWCARHGLGIFQTLPIGETGGDHCPYNAITALAIDPATLAVSPRHIADLSPEAFERIVRPELLAELRSGPVDYPRVKALKQALLQAAFEQFAALHLDCGTPRADKFRRFTDEHAAWLHDYAFFRALMWENGDSPDWEGWPAEHQSPEQARVWLVGLSERRLADFRRREAYFMYCQWLAFGQWQALKAHADAAGVRLMGDLPIGVARSSADVWANRDLFDLDWSSGAPPEKVFKCDPFTGKWGQNWGAPLWQIEAMRRRDFDWWCTRAHLARRFFHLCRLDHVMGLFRIYAFPWPPARNAEFLPLDDAQAAALAGGRLPGFRPFPDDTAEHLAANQSQGKELLRVILEAAGEMVIVAEDLGVVPEYVRATMDELGVAGFRVPMLFREADGRYADPAGYPENSMVQPSTHDHAPLAAAWEGLWREIENGGAVAECRRELLRAMQFAGLEGEPPREFTAELHEALLRATLRAKSCYAVVLLADILGETERINTPGSTSPLNWSARMSVTIRGLDLDPRRAAWTRAYARLIEETGRGKACLPPPL